MALPLAPAQGLEQGCGQDALPSSYPLLARSPEEAVGGRAYVRAAQCLPHLTPGAPTQRRMQVNLEPLSTPAKELQESSRVPRTLLHHPPGDTRLLFWLL